MKKHLLVFGLIFAMFSSFAQETNTENKNVNADSNSVEAPAFCPHRINLEIGEGFANNIYKRVGDFTQYYSHGTSLNLNYAYFFNEHWGLSIGAGVNRIAAKTSLAGNGVIADFEDPGYGSATSYDLHYQISKLVERQQIWAIEVPLKAQFQWKFGDGRNGLYAGLGLFGYFPVKATNIYDSDQGVIETWGRDEYINQEFSPTNTHFPEIALSGKDNKDAKLRCSLGLDFDFGGIFQISRVADLYLGAYVKSNFLDILPKDTNKMQLISSSGNGVVFNGTLGSDILDVVNAKDPESKGIRAKWSPVQVGLKVGFQIKCCPLAAEKSRRDIEKEILEELKKKSNEPIIIKQDPQYIYIVPVCDQLEEDENGLTQKEREDLQMTVNALSNVKILFDLEKDVPKIQPSDNKFIDDAVYYLKKDKNIMLNIKGYTCDLGSDKYNRDLAQRRALSVRSLFIEKGVDPQQIQTASYTAKDPQNNIDIPQKAREMHRAVILEVKNLKAR